MDLLDITDGELYYDEPLSPEVAALIDLASELYGEGGAELPLLQAYLLAPQSLTVLVALYRYYYYQHRFEHALQAARQAMHSAGQKLGLVGDWQTLTMANLGIAVMRSMGMLRFYLLALKGAGYLNCRLERWQDGAEMLRKVAELDPADRLGADALLQVVLNSRPLPAADNKRMVG